MGIRKKDLRVIQVVEDFHRRKAEALRRELETLELKYIEDKERLKTWPPPGCNPNSVASLFGGPMTETSYEYQKAMITQSLSGHQAAVEFHECARDGLIDAMVFTGPKGKAVQIENAKVKWRREKSLKTEKNAPRVRVLADLKRKNPGATLPEAARELVSRGLMGECGDPERAAKKWIRDHAKELPAFSPGRSGHPLGVPNSRKP